VRRRMSGYARQAQIGIDKATRCSIEAVFEPQF
jgi:hypothetical protein